MPTFKSPWTFEEGKNRSYTVENPIYVKGDFAIYKQFDQCYLYTYKDIAISQLVGINKQLIDDLHSKSRPADDTARFIFDRAQSQILKHYPEY